MTKKDYVKLAKALNATRKKLKAQGTLMDSTVSEIMESILVPLCNVLKSDNKLFDEDRFYEAVYTNEIWAGKEDSWTVKK